MQVSIIIPTYNRVKDLEETLDSIIIQTILPKEIIIVDDSNNDKIENFIEFEKNEFEGKEILLKYVRNKKEKSLTIARNVGIENATGDILLFLDDDVVLDKDYISEILIIYEAYPNALGVQGYITNIVLSKFWNRINKILFRGYLEKDKCRVLPSTNTTYPYLLDKVITCQWISGSNHSYRRNILRRFKYDENLKRYSYKEDVDLSYRVFKQYRNSLYISPYAKLVHKASEGGRLPNKMRIYMKHIYSLYFFYKNIDQNIKNKIMFIWCWVGYLIMNASISILSLIIRGSKSGLVTVKYTIGAYVTCMRHLKEIKEGDLEFFNKGLR
jgi:GT2 family glycosyltransferase